MDEERKERIKAMMAMIPPHWDNRARLLSHEIMDYLESIKDDGSARDSGGGDGTADVWVTVGGTEFIINIKPANR